MLLAHRRRSLRLAGSGRLVEARGHAGCHGRAGLAPRDSAGRQQNDLPIDIPIGAHSASRLGDSTQPAIASQAHEAEEAAAHYTGSSHRGWRGIPR